MDLNTNQDKHKNIYTRSLHQDIVRYDLFMPMISLMEIKKENLLKIVYKVGFLIQMDETTFTR